MPDDLTLSELARWAEGEARHIAAKFRLGPDAGTSRAFFALAQAVKLGEEVGESMPKSSGHLAINARTRLASSAPTPSAGNWPTCWCAWRSSRRPSTWTSPRR